MIVEPSVTDLLELVDDRYELVIITSKRARQLAAGGQKLTEGKEKSVVTLASKEIAEGKVQKSMLVILAGVAGAGKDTIAKALIQRMENVISIPSFTSRAPRADDIPGVSYNFVSKEEFERMIADGELYEYDVHHENYYGTSRKLLNERIQSGKIIVKDIDVNGTEALVDLLKEDTKVVTIFLRVPKEELKHRLENRIDHLSPKEIQLRLNRFDYEESKIGIYDYVIKNDNLEKTLSVIQTIIEKEYELYKSK